MTPAALFSGARRAVRLARECEQSSIDYDKEWFAYMRDEAARHRDRARTYLKSRALLLRQPELPLERAA